MRTALLGLTIVGAALLTVGFAATAGPQDKQIFAREIDIKGFGLKVANGDVTKPTPITSTQELASAILNKEWQNKIGKQVDFANEQLLFFSWSGSGGDRLSFKVEEFKKPPVVVFHFKGGVTKDLRSHFSLYAIGKNATWRVERLR
jgi:hypothetical protein